MRSSRHCGPTRVGQIEASDLWIQEKAAKGDLNFKKVAGVDNGADLLTKTMSWNEIQSHIHKLSSQFIQDEVNMNYVGARPNGVNLPQVSQELGIAGGACKTYRCEGGPAWSDVVARVTADAVNGEILDSSGRRASRHSDDPRF